MSIKNAHSKTSVEASLTAIQKALVQHGATDISIRYAEKLPVAVSFAIETDAGIVPYRLPVNIRGVHAVLQADKKLKPGQRSEEHARLVAWRITRDWIEAQMAIIEADMVDLAEVMMPYAIAPDGRTLYDHFRLNGPGMLRLPG